MSDGLETRRFLQGVGHSVGEEGGDRARFGGEITSILGAKVSFVLERGGPGAGFIQAHSSLGDFSQNFAPDKAKETARRSFQDARIYPKEFPKDFVK